MHFEVQLLFITPAPINQSGRAHTMALPYTGMTSQNIFYRGVFQIFHAVKMVEYVGILTTNHNRSTTKYYFLHKWRKPEKTWTKILYRRQNGYYPTKPYIFRRDTGVLSSSVLLVSSYNSYHLSEISLHKVISIKWTVGIF